MQVTLASEAAREGNLTFLKWMYDKGLTEADLQEPSLVLSATFQGSRVESVLNCSPVWYACKSGHLEVDSFIAIRCITGELVVSAFFFFVISGRRLAGCSRWRHTHTKQIRGNTFLGGSHIGTPACKSWLRDLG